MNFRLLRADPAWRSLRVVVPLVAAIAAAHAAFANHQLALYPRTIPIFNPQFLDGIAAMILVATVVASLAIGFAEGMLRGTFGEFGHSIPVGPRTLVGHRFAALLALAWAPLAAAVGAGVLVASSDRLRERLAVAGANLAATLLGGVLLLIVLVLAAPRSGRLLGVIVIAGLGTAAFGAVRSRSPAFALIALLVALPLGFLVHRLSARSIPLASDASAGAAWEEPTDRARSPRVAFAWLAARTTILYWPVALTGISAILFTVVAARSAGGATFRYLLPLMFAAIVVMHGVQLLRKIAFLPISRARVLPWVALPSLACLAIGSAVAELLPARGRHWQIGPAVDLRVISDSEGGRTFAAQLIAPRETWKLAWGAPPLVEAPWGETVRPDAKTFVPGAPLHAYNPFEIDESSSERFVAWQLHRAMEAAYGTAPSETEIAERFVARSALGPFEIPKASREEWTDLQRSRRPADTRDSFARLAILVAAWFALVFALLGRNTPAASPSQRAAKWAGITFANLPFLVPIAITLALMVTDPAATETFDDVTFASVRDWLPTSVFGCAAVLVGMTVIALAVLALRFRATEVPFQPIDERNPGARAFLNA